MVAIERGRRDEELAAALAQRVQFRLYHHGGERYVLRNDGNGPAYNVRVDTGDMGVQSDRRQCRNPRAGGYGPLGRRPDRGVPQRRRRLDPGYRPLPAAVAQPEGRQHRPTPANAAPANGPTPS